MINVKRPQKGQRTLQSMFDSLNSIIDYLPTLTVRGDNYSTYVEHASNGTVVHAKQSTSPDQAGGKTYYAGSGITLSGNVFNNDVTSGRFIEVTSAFEINCTLSGGNGIEITPNGIINCTVDPGGGGNTYYADNNTLSTQVVGTTSTFYVRNVSSLLTGAGGTTVYYYGTGLNDTIIAGISSYNFLPSTGIGLIDGDVGTYDKYIAVTGDFITSTWVADNFISGGSTGDHMYYNSQEKLLKCMLTGGTNIEIEDVGNYGYINCTLTGLDQLTNTPGYITSPGPTPTAYYADDDTLSTTSNGTNFYVRNVSSLLTGAGGTTVYYYGTGLNNTIVAGISSLNYQGGNGIQITPVEGQGGVATTYASIGLSTEFYNALTTILARPATGNYVLGSLDGELTWLSTCVCDEVSNG